MSDVPYNIFHRKTGKIIKQDVSVSHEGLLYIIKKRNITLYINMIIQSTSLQQELATVKLSISQYGDDFAKSLNIYFIYTNIVAICVSNSYVYLIKFTFNLYYVIYL